MSYNFVAFIFYINILRKNMYKKNVCKNLCKRLIFLYIIKKGITYIISKYITLL